MTDVNVIAELAKQKNSVDEFNTAELVGLNDSMATAVREALDEDRKNAVKAAAKEVVTLIKSSATKKLDLINEIRAIRLKEKELLAKLKNIDAATEYGNQTSNYLPLAVQVGGVTRIPADVAHLTKIPEGFGEKKPRAVRRARPGAVRDGAGHFSQPQEADYFLPSMPLMPFWPDMPLMPF